MNVSVTISGKAGFAGRAPNFAVEVTGVEADTDALRAAAITKVIEQAAEGWLAANPSLVWEAETAKAQAKLAEMQATPRFSLKPTSDEFAGYDLTKPSVLEVPVEQWMVVIGRRVVGPFADNDSAAAYCGMIATGEPWVARVSAPYAPPDPEARDGADAPETTAERPPDRYHPETVPGWKQGAPPDSALDAEHPSAYRRRDDSGTIPE